MTPKPSSFALDRVLPHSEEAEKAVLGAILLNPESTIGAIADTLPVDAFYLSAHREIYTVMLGLYNAKQPLDILTVTGRLREIGKLEEIGGAAYLTNLVDDAGVSGHFEHYCDIIRQKWVRCRLVNIAHNAIADGYDEAGDLDTQLDTAQAKLLELTTLGQASRAVICNATDGMTRSLNMLVARLEHTGATTGLATGLRLIDHLTGGLQSCDMIVVAARPSVGKSAFMFNIATETAVRQQIPTGILSLEMSTEQVINRIWSDVAQVDGLAIQNGRLNEAEFDALTGCVPSIKAAPLFIDDTPNLTLMQVRAKARRMVSQHGIRLLCVDYLQLITNQTPQTKGNRELELNLVGAGIKSLAKELRIPILIAAQLNRKPDERPGGKPKLSDLRESGSIEMHGDVIILLSRPECGASQEDIEKDGLDGKAYADVAKQRNGPTGEVPLTFLKQLSKFVNQATDLT